MSIETVAPSNPTRDKITSTLASSIILLVKAVTATAFCGFAGVAFNHGFALLEMSFADNDMIAFKAFAWIGFGVSACIIAGKTFNELK